MKRFAAVATALVMGVSFVGCTSTKVNSSIEKPAEIETIDADKYVDLVIPDNLIELVDIEFESLLPTEKEVKDYLAERYLSREYAIEEITSGLIEEGDIIHIKYACYNGSTYLEDYSSGQDTSYQVGQFGLTLPDGLRDEIDDFLIGKPCSGEYELNTTVTIVSQGTTNEDGSQNEPQTKELNVVYTVYVLYKEGEYTYPDLEEYFKDSVSLQLAWNTYDTFIKSGRLQVVNKKKEEAFYDILDEIAAASTFKKSHKLYTRAQTKALKSLYSATANSYGITYGAFATLQGMSEDEFNKQIEEDAEKLTKEKLVFFAWLQENDKNYSDYNFSAYAVNKAEEWDFDGVPELINIYGSDSIRFELIRETFQNEILKLGIADFESKEAKRLEDEGILGAETTDDGLKDMLDSIETPQATTGAATEVSKEKASDAEKE